MKRIKLLTCSLLIATMAFMLMACMPFNMKNGAKKMENKGYTVEQISADDAKEMFGGVVNNIKCGIDCVKDEEYLCAI